MKVLESLIDIYFLIFLTILPLTYIVNTIVFFTNKKKNFTIDEKLKASHQIFIVLFVLLSIAVVTIISLFVLCYDKIIIVIGSVSYYFICFALVFLTYLLTSFIEDIASDSQKYMKTMSNNLKLSEYKDFIIKSSITQFIKVYIFICYLVAIILFQLESMDVYEFNNGFIRIIATVCENTITIILAFELLLKYKKHKRKEFDGINKGSQLFNTFFNFSIKYLNVYKWFSDNFTTVLYKEDKVFYSKISTLNKSLVNKLSDIRKETDYDIIKVSPKIKTYDIVFDTLIECVNNYLKDKQKTDDKKANLVHMIMFFQKIVKDEIAIKTQKQYLRKVCKFANRNIRNSYIKNRGY